jgi:hypothetical protein
MNEQLFAKGRASARRYLAAWFSDEDYWTEAEPDSAEWFVALAAYARSRCSRFANEEYRGAHRRIGTISVS